MQVMLLPGQHIHIIGVGGFGMSAIARVLLESGYQISGSDRQMNPFMQALQASGATIYDHHAAEHISGAELVLMSSAIPADNIEVQAAYQHGLPVINRRAFIAALTEGQKTIAIAGTHGKTTTTAMMTHVLREAGLDPSFIVGGVMKNLQTNAGAGMGEYFVIEADEYDNMFLGLNPHIAIVNNIEYDHPDFFQTPGDLVESFQRFVQRLEPDGLLIVNADDDVAATFAGDRKMNLLPVRTYGIQNPSADWWASDLQSTPGGVSFIANHGGVIGRVQLRLPGRHNVYNALGVITVARHLGIPFKEITDALYGYEGTGRRAELMGEAGGVRVINDYAHHPTAINVTLHTWRDQPGVRDLWAVWQPHTYSRTRILADSFIDSFSASDHALVTDIYAAREAYTPGYTARDMADFIAQKGHPDARYSGDIFETAQILANEVQPGDVVILLSAGDAPRIGDALLDVLRRREGQNM